MSLDRFEVMNRDTLQWYKVVHRVSQSGYIRQIFRLYKIRKSRMSREYSGKLLVMCTV